MFTENSRNQHCTPAVRKVRNVSLIVIWSKNKLPIYTIDVDIIKKIILFTSSERSVPLYK